MAEASDCGFGISDCGFIEIGNAELWGCGIRNGECGTFGEARLSGLGGQAGGVGMENSAF